MTHYDCPLYKNNKLFNTITLPGYSALNINISIAEFAVNNQASQQLDFLLNKEKM